MLKFSQLKIYIYNIFVDKTRINLSSLSPLIKGLSDAQILTVKNIHTTINKFPLKKRIRLIDNDTITKFQVLKAWEYVCIETDPNHVFNSIL